jgi:hypothetical protein
MRLVYAVTVLSNLNSVAHISSLIHNMYLALIFPINSVHKIRSKEILTSSKYDCYRKLLFLNIWCFKKSSIYRKECCRFRCHAIILDLESWILHYLPNCSVSSLAWFMSYQEASFVTIGQRLLANPLRYPFPYFC